MSSELMVSQNPVSGSAVLDSLSHYIGKPQQLTRQPQYLSFAWKVSTESTHTVAEALTCLRYTVKIYFQVGVGQKNR